VSSDTDKPKPSPAVLGRLMGEYRHDLPLTVVAVAISLAGTGAELLPHVFIRMAINYLQQWFEIGPVRPWALAPWSFVVLIVLAYLLHNLLRFAQMVTRMELSTRITNHLRRRVYSAVQRHSLTYHKQTTTGDLIARATGDVRHMARFIFFAVFGTADMVIFLFGAVGILFWIDWGFALVVLAPVPLAVVLTVRLGMKVRPVWRASRDAYGQVTTSLQENIAGARVVRAFAQERAEEGKFGDHTETFLSKVLGAIEYWVVRMVGPNFLFGLVMPAAVVYGGAAVIRGSLHVGDIFFCFSVMQPIQRRLHHVMRLVDSYQRAAAGAERVYEILDEEPSIRSKPGAKPMPPSPEGPGAAVAFENVSFGYEPDKPVIQDVAFRAEPGQTVAIVGHTGSGKSTLISLIPRFHDPTAGRVLINGFDARDIRLDELRRAIGIIFQETFLFSASVRENLAYGQPDAPFEAVRTAAQAAQAHRFITGLEDGYDTIIGERGVTLSGGQAQRLAIARAVLLDPSVLVMDDATASVDSETERLIRETMKRVAEGRTNFVIAHRISSVAHADLILVLKDGRIAERGTHAELVRLGGIYRRMCDQQFAGKNVEV
jgi:ABC-type multidrug transport system fused ATPase/permease subunit